MYKLERCPICGGVAAIKRTNSVYSNNRNHNEYEYRYQIVCQNCGLTTKSVTVQFGYSIDMGAWAITDELDKLVSTWNNREGV